MKVLLLLNSFDSFYTGLYRLSLSEVNQLDSSLDLMCLFMLFSTFYTFYIDSSMAYCSAMISFSRLLRNRPAFSINSITCSFSVEVAMIFL